MDAQNSNPSVASVERATKKQKMDPPTFTNDPGVIVTFLVGPAEKPTSYIVHKEFALSASPVLNAAFTSGFIESLTYTYKLEDTTPRAFRFFMQWVYNGNLKLLMTMPWRERERMQAAVPPYYEADSNMTDGEIEVTALVEAWVLADKLFMPAFQNKIMESFFNCHATNSMAPRWLHYLYENTTLDSPLRKFFVEDMAKYGVGKLYRDHAELLPHQFLVELSCKLSWFTQSPDGQLFMDVWPIYMPEDYFVETDRSISPKKDEKLSRQDTTGVDGEEFLWPDI